MYIRTWYFEISTFDLFFLIYFSKFIYTFYLNIGNAQACGSVNIHISYAFSYVFFLCLFSLCFFSPFILLPTFLALLLSSFISFLALLLSSFLPFFLPLSTFYLLPFLLFSKFSKEKKYLENFSKILIYFL